MRDLLIPLILTGLSGCVISEHQTTFFEPEPPGAAQLGRFSPQAEAYNPGHGIIPEVEGADAWMSMGDRICEVRGNSGAIATDIFIDGDVVPGLVLVGGGPDGWIAADGSSVLVTDPWGNVEAQFPIDGDILGAVADDSGIWVLVSRADGCYVVLIQPDGTQETFPVDDETCDPDADIEATASGVLLGGGPDILEVTPGGVEPIASGDQVAADPTTGLWYSGATGAETLMAHHADGTTQVVPVPGGLVDFSARNGELIALTEDHKLVQYDTATHNPLVVEPYYGPLGIHRLQLTGDASGIVLNSTRQVKFYWLRNDRAPAEAPPETGEGTDSSPGDSQGM